MSFVPNPTQANASTNNAKVITTAAAAAGAAGTTPEEPDQDIVFKLRTFDVYWVEKHALMYKDGTTTVSFYYLECLLERPYERWMVFVLCRVS